VYEFRPESTQGDVAGQVKVAAGAVLLNTYVKDPGGGRGSLTLHASEICELDVPVAVKLVIEGTVYVVAEADALAECPAPLSFAVRL